MKQKKNLLISAVIAIFAFTAFNCMAQQRQTKNPYNTDNPNCKNHKNDNKLYSDNCGKCLFFHCDNCFTQIKVCGICGASGLDVTFHYVTDAHKKFPKDITDKYIIAYLHCKKCNPGVNEYNATPEQLKHTSYWLIPYRK